MFQLYTGHQSAIGVSETQPAKLAAFEGHYDSSAVAPIYLFGWVDDRRNSRLRFAIPTMLSYMIYGDFQHPVTGFNAFDPQYLRPGKYSISNVPSDGCHWVFADIYKFIWLNSMVAW